MMQRLFDDFREWRLQRHQAAAKRHVVKRDLWRIAIGRPWNEAVCWWCIGGISGAGLLVWWVLG